jgi:hypothetical protein
MSRLLAEDVTQIATWCLGGTCRKREHVPQVDPTFAPSVKKANRREYVEAKQMHSVLDPE